MATVKFEFDYFEEREQIQMVQHALEMSAVLSEIDNMCRNRLKHENIESKEIAFLEQIRQYIGELHHCL